MEKECGVLQLRPPNTFSWKIGNKNSTCRWISRSFSIHGCSNNFCLLIQPIEKDTEFGIFYLCQANNAVLKSCNLNISLTYTHERKSLLGKNSKPVKSGPWFMYELATIKTNNLLEVTGAYIKREISNETVQVLDKASVDITGESSKKRKQEGSSTIEEKSSTAEQNKRINTIGLDALSGNLKDAFLSAEDTDVVIKVGEKEYRTHKVILKNRSPVFYSMLKYDMIEKNQGIIDISDCDPDIFRDFLLYLYTGKVDSMSKGNVFELYYMSDKYGVELLKLDCVDFILNNLDLDIICDVITLATRHLEREVLKHAISFFTYNAKEIFLTSNWQKYIKEYPIQANELIIKAFNKKS